MLALPSFSSNTETIPVVYTRPLLKWYWSPLGARPLMCFAQCPLPATHRRQNWLSEVWSKLGRKKKEKKEKGEKNAIHSLEKSNSLKVYWSLQSGYLSVWLIATSSVSSNSLGEIEVLVIVVTLLALIFFSQSLSALPHIRAFLSQGGGMSGLTALKEMFNKNWWIQPKKLPFHYSCWE